MQEKDREREKESMEPRQEKDSRNLSVLPSKAPTEQGLRSLHYCDMHSDEYEQRRGPEPFDGGESADLHIMQSRSFKQEEDREVSWMAHFWMYPTERMSKESVKRMMSESAKRMKMESCSPPKEEESKKRERAWSNPKPEPGGSP